MAMNGTLKLEIYLQNKQQNISSKVINLLTFIPQHLNGSVIILFDITSIMRDRGLKNSSYPWVHDASCFWELIPGKHTSSRPGGIIHDKYIAIIFYCLTSKVQLSAVWIEHEAVLWKEWLCRGYRSVYCVWSITGNTATKISAQHTCKSHSTHPDHDKAD